ncbi:Citrinin biosynthesis transcriptional activator mrl3 [Golovinomyces cichoracearum]|uniref:Citrinin biosynthesis transcriptional activator mrl3 n=1 Tax=Golovinomyces cichoracearum TaxID=62708 RepID=A0A420I9I3_9PEZI|nr:Citrinin biosynthesis transcriptional activator mrl3 [Golovinomyces cichoracearum]
MEVTTHQLDSSAQGSQKGPEKTISCVSCRKRKLKCDRMKPKCGTCVRLRHECEYPTRRRNVGTKRRNYKEIEARLVEVESLLVANRKYEVTSPNSTDPRPQTEWNMGMGMDMNMEIRQEPILGSFETAQPVNSFAHLATTVETPVNEINGQLLSSGLQEQLPPQDMIDELYEIYFASYHPTMPIIHRARFYMSLNRAPHARPPICLSYAMWTLAASLSPKYNACEEVFYERTRRYLEMAEMKGHGESFVSLNHAQTWGLVCNYEARKMYFSRSWMSTGRMVRLTQMLGLWRLDHDEGDTKDYLPPTKDWLELEERRRTFWAAFYSDRFASSGSGWPMIIQEHEVQMVRPFLEIYTNLWQIFTDLPASEEAFESGIKEKTTSLAQALTAEGSSRLSNYGGVLLTAAYFGHFFQHVRGTGPSNHPEDIQNGEFWKRHRKMENSLNNTFIYLPESLRLPAGRRDMNVIFMHMNIQASIIGLHRTAVATANRYSVDKMVVRQCRARTFIAAEEIVSILQLTCNEDAPRMVPWVGFCLYVAAGIFLEDIKTDTPNPRSFSNFDKILNAMRVLSTHHSLIKSFLTQCELDMDSYGKNRFGRDFSEDPDILAESKGIPITVADMQALLIHPPDKTGKSPSLSKDFVTAEKAISNADPYSPSGSSAVIPKSGTPSSGISLPMPAPEFPSWESRVETNNARFDDVTYHSKYASTEHAVSNGYFEYTHTPPNANIRTEASTISPHRFPYEQTSPINYAKPVNCLPIQENVIAEGYHILNDWTVTGGINQINHNFANTDGVPSWIQPENPPAGLARDNRTGS